MTFLFKLFLPSNILMDYNIYQIQQDGELKFFQEDQKDSNSYKRELQQQQFIFQLIGRRANYNITLHIQMLQRIIFIALLIVISLQSYDVTVSCSYPTSCSTVYLKINGGPFNYDGCVTNITIAKPLSYYCRRVSDQYSVSFSCGSSDCGYCQYAETFEGNQTATKCADPKNETWKDDIAILEAFNVYLNNKMGHDWCGNVGTCLSTGAIVGIVIGAVAGVAIIIGIVCYIRRKKAQELSFHEQILRSDQYNKV